MAKILIVEDERDLVDAYKVVLKKEKHDVAVAYNGLEALEVAEKFKPDLILLDLLMPRMDGIGFLKEYNLLEKHPKVKVIVFSNLDMHKEVEEAYSLGATKYFLKAWATPKVLAGIIKDTV